MHAAIKKSLSVLVGATLAFSLMPMAWADAPNEQSAETPNSESTYDISADASGFLGPVKSKVPSEDEINAYAEAAGVTATEGWELYYTCEWKIENHVLTIRPAGGAAEGMIRPLHDDSAYGPWEVPWNSERSSIGKVILEGQKIECNDASYLFAGLPNATLIDNLSILDVSDAVSAEGMFSECPKLQTLNISGLDTSRLENMSCMFKKCFSLSTIELPRDFASVCIDLAEMFNGCCSLVNLNSDAIVPKQPKDLGLMFGSCTRLRSLDLSNFSTSNVTSMTCMFVNCRSLQSLDLSAFDTPVLQSVSDWSTDVFDNSGTSYYSMSAGLFSSCISLTEITFGSGFDTSLVESFDHMFSDCESLSVVDAAKINTTSATTLDGMFSGCSGLVRLDVSSFECPNVTSMTGLFEGCSKLSELTLGHLDVWKVESTREMFADCTSLRVIDLSGLSFQNLRDTCEMFCGCASLEDIVWGELNLSYVEDMTRMFGDCEVLGSVLDFSAYDTSRCKSIYGMFEGCSLLTTVSFGTLGPDVSMSWAFGGLRLESLRLMGPGVSKVPEGTLNLSGLESLRILDVSGLDTSGWWEADNRWYCPALAQITVGSLFNDRSRIPAPSADFISGATGLWYDKDGVGYKPEDIPTGVAGTYYAMPGGEVVGPVEVNRVTISQPSTTLLSLGSTLQLSATVDPASAANRLTWASSSPSVATVDATGKVTAAGYGTAKITASAGGKSDSITVTVEKRATGVTVSPTSKTLVVGEAFTATATVQPEGSVNGGVAWASTDPAVATVDSAGHVTAKKAGSASITATAGGYSASCAVYVVNSASDVVAVQSVTLDKPTLTLTGTQAGVLAATVQPDNATNKSVSWATSNDGIVKVSKTGELTPVGRGTAVVTATSDEGGKTATCRVTVVNPPTSVAVSPATVTVKQGASAEVEIELKGALPGATEPLANVAWASSDPEIAAVKGSGNEASIAGVAVGAATISVTGTYNGVSMGAICAVTVSRPDASQVKLSESARSVAVDGNAFTLTATVEPADADQAVTWSTSDASIATVNDSGLVTPRRAGTAHIYAKAGIISAACTVTVSPKTIATDKSSKVKGYLLVNDAEAAELLGDASISIDYSAHQGKSSLQKLVTDAAGDGAAFVSAYDIGLVDSAGKAIEWNQPEHVLTVGIAADDAMKKLAKDNDLGVHYVDDGITKADAMPTRMAGDELQFDTTHFSTYAVSAVPKKADGDGKQDGLGNVASSSDTTASGTPTQGAVKNGTAVGGDLQKTGDAMGVAVAALAVVSLMAVIVAAILCRRENDDAQ